MTLQQQRSTGRQQGKRHQAPPAARRIRLKKRRVQRTGEGQSRAHTVYSAVDCRARAQEQKQKQSNGAHQATKPLFSGIAVASSAVIIASGMLHSRGNTRKPSRVSSGPPADTASSVPKGPPDTSKKSMQRSVRKARGRLGLRGGCIVSAWGGCW